MGLFSTLLGGGALLTYGLVGAVIWFALRSTSSTIRLPTMVLEEWDEAPPGRGDLVSIRGRRAGLISFLLGAVGIDPKVRLTLRTNEVELASTGLMGHTYHRIPIVRISSTLTGHTRPLHWLLLGAALLLMALFIDSREGMMKLIMALAGVGVLAAFVLGKAAFILVTGFGGPALGIRYKGSFLNAKTVDLGAAQRFVRLMGDLTLERSAGGSSGAGEGAFAAETAPREPEPPPPPPMAYCDYCGRQGLVGQPCAHCQRIVE